MAIFKRLGDLLRANVNDMIDKAENPEKMVKLIIIDMEKEVEKAMQALGDVMASEKQIFARYDAVAKQSKSWEEKAKLALQAGNTDLAKEALAKKVSFDQNAEPLKQSYESVHSQRMALKNNVDILKQKLEEARMRQTMLIARSRTADAQARAAQTMGSLSQNGVSSKLDRMEEKIAQKEGLADAYRQMEDDGTGDLEAQFKDMQTENAVEAELARLMAEVDKK